MSTFYTPFSLTISSISMIIYPMKGVEAVVSRNNKNSIAKHLEKLVDAHSFLKECKFQIVILWKDQELMTDIWIFKQLESDDAGFTIDCRTFADQIEIKGQGITASDGLIMLGREAEQEEMVRKGGKSVIQDYVFGKRPSLPDDLQPEGDFYV